MDTNAIKMIDVVVRSWKVACVKTATADAALMWFFPHKENSVKLLNSKISVALEQQKHIYSTELEWHQLLEQMDLLSLL